MSLVTQVRGAFRLGPSRILTAPAAAEVQLSSDSKTAGQSWLEEARRLIPGEALAGYLAFQPLARAAQEPENVLIVLGIVFLVVTIVLRWVGTQDPTSARPSATTQYRVVIFSALCFVGLVYATGGQIFWHAPFPDQELYGQIGAFATGVIGSMLYRIPAGAQTAPAHAG